MKASYQFNGQHTGEATQERFSDVEGQDCQAFVLEKYDNIEPFDWFKDILYVQEVVTRP